MIWCDSDHDSRLGLGIVDRLLVVVVVDDDVDNSSV